MPDDKDVKQRFYGISEEEVWNTQQRRRTQEEWEDHFGQSVKTMRENGQDMTKIRTPRLDKMRAELRNMKRVSYAMGLIGIIASLYFAGPHYLVKSLREDKQYEKLTEEEKQLKRDQRERQLYGGKTFDELTEQEQDYYLEYYRQKEQQEDKEVMEYGFTKESAQEFHNDMIKHLVPIWAPAIFMLFVYLGRRKRAKKHEQAAADAANFMLDWAEMGRDYAINPEMLENIMNDEFARDIIAYMAPTEAVWFEMLLDGNVEIADNPDFRNMATTILARYLERHPEAFDKVLEKFGRDAIPQALIPGSNYATAPMYEIKHNR